MAPQFGQGAVDDRMAGGRSGVTPSDMSVLMPPALKGRKLEATWNGTKYKSEPHVESLDISLYSLCSAVFSFIHLLSLIHSFTHSFVHSFFHCVHRCHLVVSGASCRLRHAASVSSCPQVRKSSSNHPQEQEASGSIRKLESMV